MLLFRYLHMSAVPISLIYEMCYAGLAWAYSRCIHSSLLLPFPTCAFVAEEIGVSGTGTRLYYAFFDVADETDFQIAMNGMVREIGERGSAQHVSEAVPPEAARRVKAPAPAPAPTPAPATASAPRSHNVAPVSAPALAPAAAYTPSMQMSAAASPPAEPGALTERLLTMLETQQVKHQEREDSLRSEMDAKIKSLRTEISCTAPQEAVTQEQIVALQARLETLRVSKLLSEADLDAVEDTCADYLELRATMGAITLEALHASEVVRTLITVVALSDGIEVDRAFARQ
eukprot:COSAG02_NODE_9112_length_2326_cov_1.163000_1_plen_287_part_10